MCIDKGILYEDYRHNCCFVGFDTQGVPRYAMLRSSDPASTFLREVEGSDKRYSFSLPPQERSNTLYLFESAIDCLSFAELQRMGGNDWKIDNYLYGTRSCACRKAGADKANGKGGKRS